MFNDFLRHEIIQYHGFILDVAIEISPLGF